MAALVSAAAGTSPRLFRRLQKGRGACPRSAPGIAAGTYKTRYIIPRWRSPQQRNDRPVACPATEPTGIYYDTQVLPGRFRPLPTQVTYTEMEKQVVGMQRSIHLGGWQIHRPSTHFYNCLRILKKKKRLKNLKGVN